MSFLNPILLAGAAAFLIPLIIHLLNKRKVITVLWGPMHLLHEALRQKKRNVKMEQKLLLAVRISIPILLALCLALPVLSALSQLPGFDKTSLLVVLDNSFSMRAPGTGGTARDKARNDLRQTYTTLSRGSDTAVILAGAPPHRLTAEPTSDLEAVPTLLENEPSLGGPLALQDTFQLVQADLGKLATPAREVLLVSDFKWSDWRQLAEGGTLPALESILKQERPPLVTFLRSSGDTESNLAVVSVEPSAFVVARGQMIALRARIQNHGPQAYQDVAVHLEANGARLRSTRVSVAPNSESVITLTHTFDAPGDQALTVRVEGDSLPDDNAYSVIIPVREQVNCLLVRGKSRSGPLEGATDFLEIGLTPHQSAATTLKDVIRTGVIDDHAMRDKTLDGSEVVILANVNRLNDRQVQELEEYVQRGGGLIIFMGPDMDMRWYQEKLYQNGKGLLPCTLNGFGHVDEGQTPARILNQRHTHPAITYFNEARGMRLQDAAFTHWVKFDKVEGDARPILNLDRGDPLMVEKPRGKGRVIAVATTANAQWSNLPLQPAFVPLIQRLVTYLATQNAAPQSQMCGTVLRASLGTEQVKGNYELKDPMSRTREVTPRADRDGVIFVDHSDTAVPGIYELRAKNVPGALVRRFAFNLNPAESNLSAMPEENIRAMAQRLGASYASSQDEYARLDRTRRHGAEAWQPLLFALLLFLFAEVFLQQRISRA
ncbi:BatA domain-containing protein [Verrucomicrobium sp. BvORR106]|uniref:BatA domain-containing protein n=1 Tax=Verrucomicrobium sp. BvORR106 TaxID=1403819 RepID=UPI00056E3FA5|nr:BatA domain-containing protein [Verrucomicrobium sp. BvORR106]